MCFAAFRRAYGHADGRRQGAVLIGQFARQRLEGGYRRRHDDHVVADAHAFPLLFRVSLVHKGFHDFG
ncbi:MAG: hypothetical protein LBN92_03000, partial [Treponema sp.]|nr:hypothetical protein [Treponema sp.]